MSVGHHHRVAVGLEGLDGQETPAEAQKLAGRIINDNICEEREIEKIKVTDNAPVLRS